MVLRMDFKGIRRKLSNNHWSNSPWLESFLFLLIILIEAGIFFYLMGTRSIVGGHDGFQYFTLQYYFLNNAVNYGEIPQWVPFMTHGTLGTWGYTIPGGILHNVLLLSGGLFKAINYLPLFYAGIFFDELLLIVGTWLLARRFFISPFSIFFVTVSIMGSCIWMLQPWFNFHFYYAIPLILYFLHTFLDSGKWRYYLLAGNLFVIQCLGNPPYALPVTSLVIFLYFIFYFAFTRNETWKKIKGMKFGWPFVFSTFLIILSFAALYSALSNGIDQIAAYNVMRNQEGKTTLEGFLTYGGHLNWNAWLEMIMGVSPFLDYTLYIGILGVPFIIMALIFNLNKQNVHFLLTIIVLLLFSMGTFISVAFYYSWPMMKFYRHLMLVAPVVKVFLCFLAGFGFDVFFSEKTNSRNKLVMKTALAAIFILMLCITLFLYILSNNGNICTNLLFSMVPAAHSFHRMLFNEDLLTSLIWRTTFFALIAALLFAVSLFIKQKRFLFVLVILFLSAHCADMYSFKMSEIRLKTTPLSDEMYKITEFQSMPYAKRRDIALGNDNSRAALLKILPIKCGSGFYWSAHAFIFKDQLGNPFRTDFWLLPLDHYLRAYWGQSIHDLSIKPRGLIPYSGFEFPAENAAALKISGVTEDKIQFFSHANIVFSDDEIVSHMTGPDYKGDIIFLSALKGDRKNRSAGSSHLSKTDLSRDERVRLPYQVKHFDSNHLEVTADTNGSDAAWLLYSDVWHPFWQATVNDKATPVYKANLAYKAVKLKKGLNNIHFYFNSKRMSVFHYLFGINSLVWLIVIIALTINIALNPPMPSQEKKQ